MLVVLVDPLGTCEMSTFNCSHPGCIYSVPSERMLLCTGIEVGSKCQLKRLEVIITPLI